MASNLMAQDWLSDGRNQEKSMFLHDHLKKKKIHLKFQYLAVLFYLKMFPWKSYLFCCRGPIKREFDSDRGKSSPNANGTSSLVY